jgi:hypothetical protein
MKFMLEEKILESEIFKIGAHVIILLFQAEVVNAESFTGPSPILDIICNIGTTRDNGGILGYIGDLSRLWPVQM